MLTNMHWCTSSGTIIWPFLWFAYINDLTPATHPIKYMDNITVYHSIHKAFVTNLTKRQSYAILNAHLLQEAADYAFTWCKSNSILLDITKSNTIILFTLQKQIDAESLIIDDSAASDDELKLYGVVFGKHIKFNHQPCEQYDCKI